MAEEVLNKLKSIELVKEEEKRIKSYQEYLDNLSQASKGNLEKWEPISSEIFTNSGAAHASILMATLLANTEKSLKMYCNGLTPGILCGKTEGDGLGYEGAYWAEFKRFFKDTIKSDTFVNNSIQILIQMDTYLKYQPFLKVKEALQNPLTRNKIKVKIITEDSKAKIEGLLGNKKGENYNFAIFDGKAFRLEYSPNDYRAIGSFNNPSWCSFLNTLFEFAFYNAKDITNLVRN